MNGLSRLKSENKEMTKMKKFNAKIKFETDAGMTAHYTCTKPIGLLVEAIAIAVQELGPDKTEKVFNETFNHIK